MRERRCRLIILAILLIGCLMMYGCGGDDESKDAADEGNVQEQEETVEEEEEPQVEKINIDNFIGEFIDSTEGAATMVTEKDGDKLKITVSIASPSRETHKWEMTAKVDKKKGRFKYSDCSFMVYYVDDWSNEHQSYEYKNGKGYFTVQDGALVWDGAEDDECKSFVFRKSAE